jgi:hypothetical protein
MITHGVNNMHWKLYITFFAGDAAKAGYVYNKVQNDRQKRFSLPKASLLSVSHLILMDRAADDRAITIRSGCFQRKAWLRVGVGAVTVTHEMDKTGHPPPPPIL